MKVLVNLLGGAALVEFCTAKISKIRRDFGQLQTSIANSSGTDRDINKRKTALSTILFLPCLKEKLGELWSTNQEV